MTTATSTEQFKDLINWMEDRWPGTRNFRNAAAVYFDFAPYNPADLREAARSLYREGKRNAPTFSELAAEVSRLAAAKYGAGWQSRDPRDLCAGTSHRYAIVEEHLADGTTQPWVEHPHRERTGICVVCKDEKVFPGGALLTSTELEEREARRIPGDRGPIPGDRSEHIAP